MKIIGTLYILIFTLILNTNVQASGHEKTRIDHVQELLGKHYNRSIAGSEIEHEELKKDHASLVKKLLPQKYKADADKISRVIIDLALAHRMDPMFLTAMIMNESSFNPEAKGTSGEVGLMQILPGTGRWLAKRSGVKWMGKKTLKDPIKNIKIGTTYISHLRKKYRHGQLYMAAYNMGPGNLKKALRRRIRPKDYTQAVMKRYIWLYENLM